MNDESNRVPFFINTKRLQRDDSYFDIGRTHEKLRRFLEERRNSNTNTSNATEENLDEEYGAVGYYGVSRFISLQDDDQDSVHSDNELIDELDEDVEFDKTSGFKLFWMIFKRFAATIGERFLYSTADRRAAEDIECHHNQDFYSNEDLCKMLIEPSYSTLHDPRVKDDLIVYGDINYLIQKFRMELTCGSVDVALFSVELSALSDQVGCSTDLQAFVVSPECGSYVWIEGGRASAIFLTRSSEAFFGSIMEWFRKILSDMVLADSVMIGHPYYWHPNIRRRLRRVMKYLKRLYRKLARRERQPLDTSRSSHVRTDLIEVVRPTDISKIVINEQPSRNLDHANSTCEKLNIMLEQLVKKWFDYQFNLTHSPSDNVQDISKAYTILNPQHNISEEMLESVTFLDFFPQARQQQHSEASADFPSYESCRQSPPIRDSPSSEDTNLDRVPRKRHRDRRDCNRNCNSPVAVHGYPNATVISEVGEIFEPSTSEKEDSEQPPPSRIVTTSHSLHL